MAYLLGPYGYADATLVDGLIEAPYRLIWIEPYADGRVFRGRFLRIRFKVENPEPWYDPSMVSIEVDGQWVPHIIDGATGEFRYIELFQRTQRVRSIVANGV